MAPKIQLQPCWIFLEFRGAINAAEGMEDLGELRGLMADGERGRDRDRVVSGAVDGHPRRQYGVNV